MSGLRPGYLHGHHDSVLRSHGVRTATDSAAYLLPHLRPDMSVLDVGCGPGSITIDLAHWVPQGRVVGVDCVEAPLLAARATAATRGDRTTRFEVADAHQLPFEDHSFDVVHAHQLLQHLADPVGALREMARVCRPGGIVAARDVDYGSMTWHPASPGMTTWLDVYRRLAWANHAEPDAGRRLRSWAQQAGLTQVRASASTWCYASPDDTAWWGEVWARRAVESRFAEQARAHGLLDQAGLQEISEAWQDWSRRPDAWFSMVHGEVLATSSSR